MNRLSTFIRQYPIPFIFVLSVVVAISLWLTRPTQQPADTDEKARLIDVMTVTLDTLSPTIPVFVQLTTPFKSQLRSSVTADVARLAALEGSAVKRGELLVLLDDQEARLNAEQRRADVMEVEAQIAAEHNDHENELFVLGDKNKLSKQGLRNRENIIKEHKIRLDRLNALLIRAQASLKMARLDLERTQFVSPFNGRVTRLHVSVGDRVRPGDSIIEVYDQESLELRGPVPARYIGSLQQALSDNLILNGKLNINNRIVEARLDRLTGEVNERSGSVDAIFNLSETLQNVQLGRAFQLELELPPVARSFAVPVNALYGTDRVYRIVDQRLQSTRVKRLGDFPPSNGIAQALVTSDEIQDGDLIMVTQLPNAIGGMLVKPARK